MIRIGRRLPVSYQRPRTSLIRMLIYRTALNKRYGSRSSSEANLTPACLPYKHQQSTRLRLIASDCLSIYRVFTPSPGMQSSTPVPALETPQSPQNRRNGKASSCEPCRLSKVRCDHRRPICSRCYTKGRQAQCIYHPAPLSRPSCRSSRWRVHTAASAETVEGQVTRSNHDTERR